MKSRIFFILSFLAFFISYGQISLLAEASTKEPKQNERFTLTIVLEINGNNVEQQSPIKLPDLSKFEILGTATEQASGMNPRTRTVQNQVFYQVILQPKEKGKVKIGSASVWVNDKLYKTEPIEIVVKAGSKNVESPANALAEIYLSLEISDKEVFENEPTIATVRAYGRNVDDLRKIKKAEFPKEQGYDVYSEANNKGEIEYESDVLSQVLAKYVVLPQRSGVIVLPQASVTFFSRQAPVSSNRAKVLVKTLPKDKPENFDNSVGDFNLNVKVDKSKAIEINKPFNVQIKVSGKGNLKSVKVPKILESSEYSVFKPKVVTKYEIKNDKFTGFVSHEYVVIPRKTGDIELKIEPFVFFNPDKNDYIELKADSDDLKINSVEASEIAEKDSSEEKILDQLGDLLSINTVDKTKNKQEDNQTLSSKDTIQTFNEKWVFIVVVVLLGLIIWFFVKNRKIGAGENKSVRSKITNIAEEEARIKESLGIDIQASFEYLVNLKKNKKYADFLNNIQLFCGDLDLWSTEKHTKNLRTYLEDNFGGAFSDSFFDLIKEFDAEKYTPIHSEERIGELFSRLEKFYNQIVK